MTALLDFAEMLHVLSFAPDEYVSLLYIGRDGIPHTAVGTLADAIAAAPTIPATADAYFGACPVKGPARARAGRRKEADVTRLSGLWCDLDVKPGACSSLDVAHAIVADLSAMLGTRPSVLVYSGSGLHAWWPIDDGQIVGDITPARALVKRWGRLVEHVADSRNVAVDPVYDLARAMRLVGSHNCKSTPALLVTALRDSGGPLTMAEVDAQLTAYGIDERPDDRVVTGDEISSPAGWVFARRTCPYVAAMIARWPTDRPNGGRNPYVYSRFIRLFCARRLGCISEVDYHWARQALVQLLAELVSTIEPRRAVKRFEIADMVKHGIARVAAKTDEQAGAELRNHGHLSWQTFHRTRR